MAASALEPILFGRIYPNGTLFQSIEIPVFAGGKTKFLYSLFEARRRRNFFSSREQLSI
jgi:hypothetical protein